MRTRKRLAWPVVLLLAAGTAAGAGSLSSLLPGDGVPPGWARRGEARLFVGPELYRHINGGAELYHRNGFDRLAVQDYGLDGREVRIEIYRMKTAAGAAAIFAEITSGLTAGKRFGSACVLDDFQITFLRDECCATLTTYESSAEATAAMAAMAERIDAALAGARR